MFLFCKFFSCLKIVSKQIIFFIVGVDSVGGILQFYQIVMGKEKFWVVRMIFQFSFFDGFLFRGGFLGEIVSVIF